MLIPYTKVVGADVVELKTQLKIGQISDLIIQRTDLKISGLTLQKSIFEKNIQTVATIDILNLSPEGVIVSSVESISMLTDNIRMKESYEKGYCGIYQRVETKSGKKIGIVLDYLIESSAMTIAKFYLKTLLSEKIISASSVIRLDKKRLIIKNDYENVPAVSPITESGLA